MADTGAPWNIPYVEPADLVRDYPAADEAQALAIAAGLTAASVVKQVVTTTKTDTYSEAVSGISLTSANVTGLEATITPAATSRLIVTAYLSWDISTSAGGVLLYRDGAAVAVGDAAGSRRQATTVRVAKSGNDNALTATIVAELPASAASATTFGIRFANGSSSSGTAYLNRSTDDSNNANNFRGISTITVTEVAV
jgi:hypothetical protein